MSDLLQPSAERSARKLSWSDHDYRAITAGVVFLLMALVAYLASPTYVLDCRKDRQRCELQEGGAFHATRNVVDLAAIERVKKECEPQEHVSTCTYAVLFVHPKSRDRVFANISTAEEADKVIADLHAFLNDPTRFSLRISRTSDRAWVYILASLGAVLVALGIRKNLT